MPLNGNADERILSFDSEIVVATDGSMQVTETIRVRAEGNQIRRGIFRDFPTEYQDRFGNRYRVGFDVLSVLRDGFTEPYRRERQNNGVRVYIGNSDYLLPVGEYEYQLRYRTERQLGFFADHDELYWNVTGNGWGFPIDNASARVVLPPGLPAGALDIVGYVGPQGSTEQTYDVSIGADGMASIRSRRGLSAREGLTLVASWPKGLVDEPTAIDETVDLLTDNRGLLVALFGFVSALLYLLYTWNRVGRDPQAGVVFPHYEPPERFSPASVRYVSKMGYDSTAFTAAIINLAVKGFVEIDESDDTYTLRATPDGKQKLAAGERALLNALFSKDERVVLKNKNHKVIRKTMRVHGKSLDRDYNRIYFMTNWTLVIPALLILAIAFAIVLLTAQPTAAAIIVLAAGIPVVLLFFYLMRAPTRLGRRMLDKIEGFKLYLEVAEKDELSLRNPPTKTPELFESYLPYALALAVEQPWAEKFAGVFERLKADTGQVYRPVWYHGHWSASSFGSNVNPLTEMTSSLGSAISSSSTPPGSSSGAGGGGFSGGGGGGGGGGGW